ncbi:class F sortase [Candidatus Parcubacteria bacterium]|nr:class F sortase [Candidatus Parcubacteria bacterium]
MQKAIITILISIGTVISITALVAVGTHAIYGTTDDTTNIFVPMNDQSTGANATVSESPLDPDRIQIPVVHVNAHVQHVGVGKSGNMAVPTNYFDVGWFRLGSKPGQKGSAVIDGHVDNGLGSAGVFHDLNKLSRGDDIFVLNKTGDKIRFKVTEIMIVSNKDKTITQAVFSKNGNPRLTLITCDGVWIQSERQYDKRLIVFADLVQTNR